MGRAHGPDRLWFLGRAKYTYWPPDDRRNHLDEGRIDMTHTNESGAATRPRARDLGIPFDGQTGPANAITDVEGVTVGLVWFAMQ